MQKKPRSLCLVCGQECKRSTTQTCSRKCYHESKSRKIIKFQCAYCKKDSEYFWDHPRQYCSNKCCGLAKRGLPKSVEARQNMSRAQAQRMAEVSYTKGIGGYREDIGHYVRSSWEANIARILKYERIPYQFEPDVLELDDGNSKLFYKPDFKLKDRYIEVKGWWTEKSKRIKEALVNHPQIKVEYISQEVYTQLQFFYKNLIPNWELDKRWDIK